MLSLLLAAMLSHAVSASDATDTLKFIFMPDIHIESDFMERGQPRYTQWKPGNHAALERTFEFINEDESCKDVQFILFGGDQLNTGYSNQQDKLDDEMSNYRRLVGGLDLYRNSIGEDLSSFKFEAPSEYICKENLARGQEPLLFKSPEFSSRVIAIQGNHDTGVPEFYRNCAFQCKDTRFICFFAAYCGLPAPPGGYRSTGKIRDDTFEFVKEQIEKAAVDEEIKHIVLVCHWGIANDIEKFINPIVDACPANKMNDNRQKLLSLCEQYGCSLFINGHEHNQDFSVAMFGNTPDINCGSMVHNTWSIVEITGDKAFFHVYAGAQAVEDSEGKVRFTSQPHFIKTVEIPLGAPGNRTECGDRYDRVVLRLVEKDFQSTSVAADNLIAADQHFVYERVPGENDSPEMKSLLAKISWKGNPLVEKLELPSSIRVVDVIPGEEQEIIRRIREENWTVKTPAGWMKIIREERRTYSFRTFYVSNSGDDTADGLTPESAWRTLERVNSAELGYGDSVLFKAGDIFRGHLAPQSGRPKGEITYASYGAGAKPVIEPSFDASREQDWTQVGPRLWKCVKPGDRELANIIFDHGAKGCAWKEDRMDQLCGRDLHFTWVMEEGAVYMVSGKNPALRFDSIELAQKRHIINEDGCHDVRYDGLHLRYGGAHGIGGYGVKRIEIKNCDICWIGGSTLYIDNGGRGVRYGNGIEFWGSASDVLVEGCRIWECWDAGITHQSNNDGTIERNITIRGNEIWNCEYSYEYWQQGEGSRTENILFENNFCHDAGRGWGHSRRWNPNAAHLMFYDNTAQTTDFVIRGNVFSGTENCCLRLFNAWYRNITMEGNTWDIRKNHLCRYHGRPTSNLIYRYPDHLDVIHDDNEAEIQSQTVETPEKFGHGEKELKRFLERFNFGR